MGRLVSKRSHTLLTWPKSSAANEGDAKPGDVSRKLPDSARDGTSPLDQGKSYPLPRPRCGGAGQLRHRSSRAVGWLNEGDRTETGLEALFGGGMWAIAGLGSAPGRGPMRRHLAWADQLAQPVLGQVGEVGKIERLGGMGGEGHFAQRLGSRAAGEVSPTPSSDALSMDMITPLVASPWRKGEIATRQDMVLPRLFTAW